MIHIRIRHPVPHILTHRFHGRTLLRRRLVVRELVADIVEGVVKSGADVIEYH